MPSSLCHTETTGKKWSLLLVQASLWLFLFGFLGAANAQSPQMRLRRITYVMSNLDSTLKAFLGSGFVFDRTEYHSYGPFEITLPAGHTVAIIGSDTTDTTNPRSRALRQFGGHIASVEFEVEQLEDIARMLDSFNVEHGALGSNKFSIVGTAPLEISFAAASNEEAHVQGGNRYSRISWLVFTANDSTQAMMRKVFAALGLRQSHEGCCDYWLVGPVESRTAIRFELPPGSTWASPPPKPHPEPGWLSIEEGGVVYAY